MTIEDYSQKIGISVEILKGRSRKMEISIAREVYWYYARYKAKFSVMCLARMFGREHSSIISGINKVSNMVLVNDPNIRKFIQFIN